MYRLARKLKFFAGCVFVLTAITSPLSAMGVGPAVPEIDLGVIGSATALLVEGIWLWFPEYGGSKQCGGNLLR